MTIEALGQRYGLPAPVLRRALDLRSPPTSSGRSPTCSSPLATARPGQQGPWPSPPRRGRKNWLKIAVKFSLWGISCRGLLPAQGEGLNPRRPWASSFTERSSSASSWAPTQPHGHREGHDRPGRPGADPLSPRLLALAAMLLLGTWLANKLLCAWGCQFGTLQDLLFRLGRDRLEPASPLPSSRSLCGEQWDPSGGLPPPDRCGIRLGLRSPGVPSIPSGSFTLSA
jgi:hypothetical protein